MTGRRRDGPSVVVPAVDAASSTAVLRSLGRRGVHTVAVSEHETPPAFSSRYCDEKARVPSPHEDLEAYREALLSFARRDDVRTIVPMREEDVYVLAKGRESFAEHVVALWPTPDQLEAAQDRDRLFAVASELGIPIPETSLLGDVDDWDREQIVKSRYATLTADQVESASTAGTLSAPKTIFLEAGDEPDVEAIRAAMHHDPIVQEYVDGTEYTFRGVFDHGEPVATSLKRLVRGVKYARGPSVCHEADRVPELEAQGLELLEHLEWHGLASVGFLHDEAADEYKLMEINPRFWSNLPMDLHAGVDHPYYFWCVASGDHERVDPDYEVGTRSHLLRGELVHLHSVVAEEYPLVERPSLAGQTLAVLASLYEQPNFDYLDLEDPRPFLRDVLNTAVSLRPR